MNPLSVWAKILAKRLADTRGSVVAMIALASALALCAQTPTPSIQPPASNVWATKTFDVKYADPEQIRRLYSGQSYVMEANRELKLLTARGSAAFLKDVEDTIKRIDLPPPIPPNAQVTVYLLASAPQAPAGVALPAELKALEKELPAKMADIQMLRVRAGQAGETTSEEAAPAPAVSLARIRVDSSSINAGAKGDIVSLNGLKIWINNPPADPAIVTASVRPTNSGPDVTADLDLTPNQAAIVAKIGVEKPIALVVRVSVIR